MWFWGSILGLLAGASMGQWWTAFTGAMLGWMGGLWLSRQGVGEAASKREADLDKRLTQAQKAIVDLQQRLARLESGKAGVANAANLANAPRVPRDEVPAANETPAPEIIQPTASEAPPIAPPLPDAIFVPVPVTPIVEPAVAMAAEDAVAPPVVKTVHASAAPAAVARNSGKRATTAPPVPTGPRLIERLFEGNIVAKLGVVVLFFGVGFLLKYAYDNGMFPPELRLFGVAAASAVMFFIGRRVMAAKRTYALVLMGGAMGLLYLDVFFALKTFGLIGAPLGFVLFAALGVATIFLAVRMDARAFAALGLIGAFLAPILASTGSGNHVLLFSYYLLLNLIILGASWFRSWRELNFIGFLFTFAIALIWGNSTYRPEHFASVEPFLIAFFLLYLAIPILFATRQPPQLKGIVDATLVFGMPMSAAMLQAALTRGMDDYVLAWSALGAAMVYGGLAWSLWSREKMRLLAEAHLALAVVFGTVAPYFAFQGYPTFAFWTLEGAAIYWIGCRQKSWLPRTFALCLQLGAAGYFLWVTRHVNAGHPWLNDAVIGCGLIAVASMITAWFMHKFAPDISAIEEKLESWVLAWSGAWWLLGFTSGAYAEWSTDLARFSAALIFVALSLLSFELIGSWLNWNRLRRMSLAHAPLMALIAFLWFGLPRGSHPLQDAGMLAWPFSFAVFFLVLHRQRKAGIESGGGWQYGMAWTLMLLMATWEAVWRYDSREYGVVFLIGVAGLAAAALRFRLREFDGVSDVNAMADDRAQVARPMKLGWSTVPLLWSLFWWFAGIHGVIESQIMPVHHFIVHLAAGAASMMLFEVAGKQLGWIALRRTQVLLSLTLLAAVIHLAGHTGNPWRDLQLLGWLVALGVGDFILHRQESARIAVMPAAQHVALFALALALLAFELVLRAGDAGLSSSWKFAGVGASMAFGLALATFAMVRGRWPFATHVNAFRLGAVLPLLLLTVLWTLFANVVCDGDVSPLPYLPVLNPLDLAQIALFVSGAWAMHRFWRDGDANHREFLDTMRLLYAAAAFLWLNAAVLRTIHQWAGVPFELHALLASHLAQAALSLMWTVTALVLMLMAGRRQSRPLWMVGAALLGLVVLKLFVNDIGASGTARVVSFIGVGVLLLVIGYVAPVPPKSAKETESLPAEPGAAA